MAAPARYWRVRVQLGSGGFWGSTAVGKCRWFNAAGVDLSKDLLAAAITITGGTDIRTGGATTNLVDASNSTEIWFAPYHTWDSHIMNLTFDFGTPVLPDYVEMVITPTETGPWGTQPSMHPTTLTPVYVFSSSNNTNWDIQCFNDRPFSAYNTAYRLSTTVSSKDYPVPSRTNLGGSGGIYGIVSEDGVALPNRPVYLFDRTTMSKIGFVTTDQYGGYAFNGLNELKDYMLLSTDPSGPPYKNALVWDRINPINTKGNIVPVSPFWARRARHPQLGGVVSCANYLSGTTYCWIGGNVLGQEGHYQHHGVQFGFDFVIVPEASTAGGTLKFLKSNRTTTSTGMGMTVFDSEGVVSPTNAAAQPENYSALTFEYIFKAPSAGESALIVVHAGTRDSDDARQYAYDNWQGHTGRGAGPTLEVTTAAINVRFPLGASNRATVLCTAVITPGTVYHVMVAYKESDYIELYVNGALAQKTLIAGGGRLYGHNLWAGTTNENWDYLWNGTYMNPAYIRRLNVVHIGGYGQTPYGQTSDVSTIPPGYGGAVAFVGKYYKTFSAAEVASFYDSYLNWDTHTVGSTQSGYMAEVEADNPAFYTRLNDLAQPAKIPCVIGQCDYFGTYEAATLYNRVGFVSGSTAVNFSNGAAVLTGVRISTVFSLEFFCRQTSTAGTQRILLTRRYNGNPHIYLTAIAGALSLSLCDNAGQTVDISLGHTLVYNTATHVVVTYDPWTSKFCRLYINGVMVTEKGAPVIAEVYANTWNTPFLTWLGIGCNPSGTTPTIAERFYGDMGELALYQYELPAARIAAHYAARNA